MPHRVIYNSALQRLRLMGRPGKHLLLLGSDAFTLALAIWVAYSLRLGVWFVPTTQQALLMLALPLVGIPVYWKHGLYRSVIRYLGVGALWPVAQATLIVAAAWAVIVFMTELEGGHDVLPRSVPILFWIIGTALAGGTRFAARALLWSPLATTASARPALIYGVCDAGRQMADALRHGRELFPLAFIDDDERLVGEVVAGVPVHAPAEVPQLVAKFAVHDAIITLPGASNARRREVVEFLAKHAVRARILPSLSEIASGRHAVGSVREVDVGELLGRPAVPPDPALLGGCITGKVVMVTGAGGSIGSEICRQVAVLSPKRIVLVEICEFALYQVERQLSAIADCELVPALGSVGDADLMSQLFAEHRVQTVYHAAAYKHVPLVEANIVEGVRNNVFGTRTLAWAAYEAGVETFVLISTDKAVRPTNIMGATKRWAELIVQGFAWRAAAHGSHQRFCAVRFGNVLESSGSVIPLFREQINQGGPVTVTHAEVTRYFMSINEAAQLVMQAGSMARAGEIFLLDMGQPVRIRDLARNMIRLTGHTVRDESDPDGDIEILVTGLRPGEKLYEELLIAVGGSVPTSHPRIMAADGRTVSLDLFSGALERLGELVEARDQDGLRRVLWEIADGGPEDHGAGPPAALGGATAAGSRDLSTVS